MSRTTDENVSGIIDVSSGQDLTAFLLIANELVTECCGDSGYTDVRLELIERYLAAHFYTNYDPRATSEAAGSVSASYQGSTDKGFDSSFYGQTAMRLDTAGGLAALNEKIKKGIKSGVGVNWLGTPKTEATDI